MRTRSNLLFGLTLVAISSVLLLRALGLIPDGLYDLLSRAWPAVIILFGLVYLLRNRVPLGGLIALAISVALVVNVALIAFSVRTSQQRDDNVQQIAQEIGSDVSLLQLSVDTLRTDLNIGVSLVDDKIVSGEFIGSTENRITVEYEPGEGGLATLTFSEEQPNAFPMLEAVGRGQLNIDLPADLAIDLLVISEQGSALLNLTNIDLERLNFDLLQGDAQVTLPEYEPLSPSFQQGGDTITGTITIRSGDLVLQVPETIGSRLELRRLNAGVDREFDETAYRALENDVLESRNYEDVERRVRYSINVSQLLRVEQIESLDGLSTNDSGT